MLKKTITFKDLDGNDITEEFYFNLSVAELAELEAGKKGGLSTYIETIVKDDDRAEVVRAFKEMLGKSVGRRSSDGRRLMKSKEITQEFFESDAFSELFFELISNANGMADFVNAIVPEKLQEKVNKITSNRQPVSTAEKRLSEAIFPEEHKVPQLTPEQLAPLANLNSSDKPQTEKFYSWDELMNMPQEEFLKLRKKQ